MPRLQRPCDDLASGAPIAAYQRASRGRLISESSRWSTVFFRRDRGKPSRRHQPAKVPTGSPRSIKSRVLVGLGLLPPPGQADEAPARFAYPEASLMPSRVSQTPGDCGAAAPLHGARPHQRKLLEDAIRAALPGLATAEASHYQRLLDNTMQAGDPARQTILLQMLEANVRTAVARHGVALSHPTIWQSFAKTSLNVNFQDSVASITRAKQEKLLQLQLDILKLPPALATGYRTLLREVLASADPAKRDALLTRMAKQVAVRANRDPAA